MPRARLWTRPGQDFRPVFRERDLWGRCLHRTHHVVVFVIEDVAVPDIAGPLGRIEGEWVEAGHQGALRCGLWCNADEDSGDLSGWRDERVFPPALGR